MTTYARIQSGVVAELFTTTGDITTMFNPALIWVPVGSSGAQVGWAYVGGSFSMPPAPPAPTQAQLQAYANGKANALMAVARTYALAGSPAVSVKCDTMPSTGADLAGLNLWGAASPTATTKWVDDFGVATTITGAQGVALATDVVAYGQTVFNELGTATTEISSGTITTTAQIDALTWPA